MSFSATAAPVAAQHGDIHHGNSHHDNVDFGRFDPHGVAELRRTLSRASASGIHPNDLTLNDLGPGERASKAESVTVSETTLPNESTTDNAKKTDEDGFDFEKTLREIVARRADADIESRELGVVFEDLSVTGVGSAAAYQPTLGSMFNPVDIVRGIQGIRHPATRQILSGFEGVVRPGEMLLVLGRPGAGCSTFLKTIANQRDEYHSIDGQVDYDSLSPAEIAKHYRGDVLYCPEDDVHFPTLTVEQTLKFAAYCRAPRDHHRLGHSRESYEDVVTDVLLTLFGLQHTATRSSTRGLDASTALEFVQALRIATDVSRMSTVVALYQAGESLYRLFDKVAVINEGRLAYYGPADQARTYFNDMGYTPITPRQTTADFLVSVTDPAGRVLRDGVDPASKSAAGQANRDDIVQYRAEFVGQPERAARYRDIVRDEHAEHTRRDSPYLISIPMQTRAVMLRRVQMTMGNFLATGINIFTFVFQGLIMGSVYLLAPATTSAYFSRTGVLFFALLFSALVTMAEIPSLFTQRPIILRHRNWGFYHPFIDALALFLVDIPITFLNCTVWGVILYFMVGLQTSAAQFFIFFLFLFVSTITMKSWFRALAAAFSAEASAQSFAGISILVFSIYTGYTIPRPSMIGALKWLTWINPLRYAYESIVTNEFRTLDGECSLLVPQGPGYENVSLDNQVCTAVGSVPGQTLVNGATYLQLSYGYTYANTWRNFGILIAFGVAFTSAYFIFTEINTRTNAASSVTLFKRGSKAAKQLPVAGGKEMAPETEEALAETPAMTDIFSFHHIHYTVPIPGEDDRQLLHDVSGFVAPGKLTALMGESGAGKTTLLNVLAERVDTGVITGDRFVNGQALPQDFQAQTGYCQQLDTHLPSSTVREALLFPLKVTYVDQCLKICGLDEYRDAAIGTCNVEIKKRTTIGVELAAKPRLLLFLDEPTAWSIMIFLRNLADHGQAILCTIHQPSAELFQVFDRLLLLRKGGETVYFGDIGQHARTMIGYFEHENPAEFMLDVIGAGATATAEQNWYDVWSRSQEAEKLQQEIARVHEEGRSRGVVEMSRKSEYATSWAYQVSQLAHRDFADHWRDPTYLFAKLILNIVGGLFIGFTFFQAVSTQQGTQNKVFALFMASILSVPLVGQIQVPFLNTRTIFEIRERPSRMFSWSALVTAQIIAEVPWNILGSGIFFLCWFWTIANILFSLIFSFVLTFDGVVQPFAQLGWWKWMYHLSPYTYLIEGLIGQGNCGHNEITCADIEYVTLTPPGGQTCANYLQPYIEMAGGYVTNGDATSDCQFCAVRTTDQFLNMSFNIYYENHWRDFGIMVAFVVFNVFLIFAFTWLFRMRTTTLASLFKRK
ncbi:ABC-2 type transporter-domain-containing protein [Schizophyllum amplum]|uniref:ABC-2 type transporter-domain-containing protein n=1 Tax=Schizophyllum amplum TaxID=97359 RepID=A0A550CB75_9AGAR|nr:ABC-2 type transporter-domain-containing protein [Auriculariopsis ampla]